MNYLSGNKDGAIAEFERAKQKSAHFRENFEEGVKDEKSLAPMLNDEGFIERVFPEGIPPELIPH